MRRGILFLVLLALASFSPVEIAAAESGWPQWRGPLANGVAPQASPPLTWSETENVRWKATIPGRGHGSPVVWGDRVYVLTAVPSGSLSAASGSEASGRAGVAPDGPLEWTVLAYDRATGEVAWRRVAREAEPHEGTHPDGSWASASPATDGEVLVAYFGSQGLYVYDPAGELLWSNDLGDMTTRRGFGEGSTPLLAGETLVVNWDHEGDSFIVAFDKRTGRELWRRERDEVTSWATPIAIEVDGQAQVVVNATGRVRSYELETGEVLWEVGGQTVNVIPTPIFGHGLVYATSGFRGSALKAIRPGAAGPTTVAWSYDRDTPYVPSPLLHGDQLYFLKVNSGILTSLDAESGEPHYGPVRLPGIDGVYASPVAAGERIYVVGRNGHSVVLRHGKEFEVLAENVLDEEFSASPAIAGDEIFLRGSSSLYCVAEGAMSDEAP